MARILTSVWLFLAMGLGSVALTEAAAQSRPSPVDLEEFRAELLDDPGYLGWFSGVIRVSQGGETRLLVAQGTDGAGRPLTEDSIFWLGSNAKMLTSAVILLLAEEGRLSLEDPVGRHLPGWSATDLTKEGESCTIERLLSHQCGLPTNVPLQDYAGLADPIRRKGIREAFLNYAQSAPLSFTPGTGYRYSNVGYSLAGLIVLQHDSGTFDEIAQRRIFQPLGLKHTGFEASRIDDYEQRAAPLSVSIGSAGFAASTWLGLEETSPAWLGSAGGAFSTPAEYSQLASALLSGSLLTDSSRARLVAPTARSKGAEGELDYAFGVGVTTSEGHTELRHGGALEPHGFSTYVMHIPEWDLTTVVMSNRGLKAYDARAVNDALIAIMKGGSYESPFPSGADSWLSASEIGLIHLVVMPLLFLSLIITAFRPTKNGRAGLAAGLAMRAWVLLFFRGLLGIHTGDPHVLGLSGVLIGTVLIVLWYRLRRQPEMPRLPPKRAWLGRSRTWLFILLSTVIMLFFALLVQIFVVQTLVLLGIAGGFVAWRRRNNTTLPAQAPT